MLRDYSVHFGQKVSVRNACPLQEKYLAIYWTLLKKERRLSQVLLLKIFRTLVFAGLYAKREGQRDNYFANYVISTKIISGIFSTTVHLRQHFGFIKPNSLNSAVTLTFILDNNSKQNR